MKKLDVAESAGFCFGVKRSVDIAEAALGEGACFCLGPLIHNDAAVDRLKEKGLRLIMEPEELPEGGRVIIRSHGVSKEVLTKLREAGAEIIDATCPRVATIHRLVSKAEEEGRLPVVVGEAAHPEVRAICGWCSDSLVVPDAEALKDILSVRPEIRDLPLSVVFQTTQTEKIRSGIADVVKKQCTNAEIFDTICAATSRRQSEAKRLAGSCDAMVVIGGRHSANSRTLAGICREACGRVQFIEDAGQLDIPALQGAETIGVTAGASVPAWIIKEVKQKMCDEMKIQETAAEQVAEPAAEEAALPVEENVSPAEEPVAEAEPETTDTEPEVAAESPKPDAEKTFDELLEDSIRTISNGEAVTGVVAAITATEISVDLGTKHSGYIPVSEFTDDGATKVEDIIHVGDRIEACVVRVNDVEGTVMLSKKRLDAVRNWSDIEAARDDGTVVEGKVTEDNKGGVVVNIRGIRVFVPASQTGLGRDVPMSELVGQTVRLKVTEVNRSRRRVVGSIRAVASRERRERAEAVWNEIEVGKHYEGVVKSMTSYGAFVDIGGIDGMVHVSELSWSRIGKPADMLNIGDKIDVYVIGFDREARRISLGHKDPDANPWKKFRQAFDVGSVVNVKIVKLMPFGAFAEVLPGVDGLIHISQIANRRIGKPEEVLTVGDLVDVKITNIDDEKQKISLSVRALSEPVPVYRREEEEEKKQDPEADALVFSVSEDGTTEGNLPKEV